MLERELVDLAARVRDPAQDADERSRTPPRHDQDQFVVRPTSEHGQADRGPQREQARAGEVDLLAGGRGGVVVECHLADVGERRDEGDAEHEERHRAGDQAGADVLARESAVHVSFLST